MLNNVSRNLHLLVTEIVSSSCRRSEAQRRGSVTKDHQASKGGGGPGDWWAQQNDSQKAQDPGKKLYIHLHIHGWKESPTASGENCSKNHWHNTPCHRWPSSLTVSAACLQLHQGPHTPQSRTVLCTTVGATLQEPQGSNQQAQKLFLS